MDIRDDVQAIRTELVEDDGEEEEDRGLTPEELARRERTTRMVEERIAYHEAKAREEEEARARREAGLLSRLRLRRRTA